MFRTWDFVESPLAKAIFTPPKKSEDYGEDATSLRHVEPLDLGLPADAIDAIGIILEKYKEDFKVFAEQHEKYLELCKQTDESELNVLPLEDKELNKSIILRNALKMGYKITMSKINNMSDRFHHVLRIIDDTTWFIRELTLLSSQSRDEDLAEAADIFRKRIEDVVSTLESRKLWKKVGKMKKVRFRPYPTWIKATAERANQWYVSCRTLCKIFIMCGLNTEVPLNSYKILLDNFSITPEYIGSVLSCRTLPKFQANFIKTTLKEYRYYILESINKKKLCDEVKNVILELLE